MSPRLNLVLTLIKLQLKCDTTEKKYIILYFIFYKNAP